MPSIPRSQAQTTLMPVAVQPRTFPNTSATNMPTPTLANGKRKRTAQGNIGQPKHPRATAGAAPRPATVNDENVNPNNPGQAVPGVGPSMVASVNTTTTPAPLSSYQSTLRRSENSKSKQAASDVWYFMHALQTREKPMELPTNEALFRVKPSAPFVGCRLCS